VTNSVYSSIVMQVIIFHTIDAVKFSNTIQLSPFWCNHVYRCVLTRYWQDDVSGNRLKYLMIFQPCNWYFENYSIAQSQTRNIKQLH